MNIVTGDKALQEIVDELEEVTQEWDNHKHEYGKFVPMYNLDVPMTGRDFVDILKAAIRRIRARGY
jgi:hypothetical protein